MLLAKVFVSLLLFCLTEAVDPELKYPRVLRQDVKRGLFRHASFSTFGDTGRPLFFVVVFALICLIFRMARTNKT